MSKKTKIILGFAVAFILISVCLTYLDQAKKNDPRSQFLQSLKDIEKNNPSLMPMYGGIEKTPGRKMADEEFVKTVIKLAGSQEKASTEAITRAKNFFQEGDLDMAMMRYNEAWLIDKNNPEAYLGFGIISGERGQIDEAIKYLYKALELKPDYAEAAYNIGFAYSQKSYQPSLSQSEKIEALKNAIKYFEDATQKDSSKAYYYGEWANVLYELGDYQEASRILGMAEKIDINGSQKLRQMINAKLNK